MLSLEDGEEVKAKQTESKHLKSAWKLGLTLQVTLPVNQDTVFLSGTQTQQLETRDKAAGGTQNDSDPTECLASEH